MVHEAGGESGAPNQVLRRNALQKRRAGAKRAKAYQRQPTRQIGQVAAEMILSLIDGSPVPEKRVVLPCDLVVRQSCRARNP